MAEKELCSRHESLIREISTALEAVNNVENCSKRMENTVEKISNEFSHFKGEIGATLPYIKEAIRTLTTEAEHLKLARTTVSNTELKVNLLEKQVERKADIKLLQDLDEKHGFWIKTFGGITALCSAIATIGGIVYAVVK